MAKRYQFIPYLFAFVLALAFSSEALSKTTGVSQEKVTSIENANKAWKDVSSDFEQKTYVSLIGKEVVKKGKLSLKKGGKINIAYSGKGEKNYVSDGTTLWIFVPGEPGSLETYALGDGNVPKEALSFLNGFGNIRKDFAIEEGSAFNEVKSGFTALKLKPRSKSAHFESLDVLFGPDGLLAELVINNPSGNKSNYKFKNPKTDQNLSDEMFTLSSGKRAPDTLPE